jgi:uncharacterized membrane protein YwaF
MVPKYTSSVTRRRRNIHSFFAVFLIGMHKFHLLPRLLYRLHTREDGFTMSEVMWSIATVALIAGIAYFIGPALGADWADFVGKPTR